MQPFTPGHRVCCGDVVRTAASAAAAVCLALPLACASAGNAPAGGAAAAAAGPVSLAYADPLGDDKGPGTYTYPTDKVYVKGGFDITKVELNDAGSDVEIKVTVASRIEDPWDSRAWGGNGFSIQMAFVHIDTDHVVGSGALEGLPGTNVRFAPAEAWDRVVIFSPQGPTRVNAEIDQKAAQYKDRIVVPKITRASGKTLVAVVDKAALGGAPKRTWGVNVLMQSNEGFPDKTDLLTRKVNEFEGQHRFGGGTDYDNDPQVIDILVAPAQGGKAEEQGQYAILSKFNKETTTPKPEDLAVVPLIYLDPPPAAAAPPAAAPSAAAPSATSTGG